MRACQNIVNVINIKGQKILHLSGWSKVSRAKMSPAFWCPEKFGIAPRKLEISLPSAAVVTVPSLRPITAGLA